MEPCRQRPPSLVLWSCFGSSGAQLPTRPTELSSSETCIPTLCTIDTTRNRKILGSTPEWSRVPGGSTSPEASRGAFFEEI